MTDSHYGFQYGKVFGKDEWYIEIIDFDKSTFSSGLTLHFPRIYGIKSEESAKKLCNLLNEQFKQIEELKKEISDTNNRYGGLVGKYNKIPNFIKRIW